MGRGSFQVNIEGLWEKNFFQLLVDEVTFHLIAQHYFLIIRCCRLILISCQLRVLMSVARSSVQLHKRIFYNILVNGVSAAEWETIKLS